MQRRPIAKTIFILSLALVMAAAMLALTSCGGGAGSNSSPSPNNASAGSSSTTPPSNTTTPNNATTNSDPVQEPTMIATLCADFSNGSSDLNIEKYELGYSGELTPEILTEGLSNLTGLDFSADIERTEMGFAVLWKENSTLITDLGDGEQKEGFTFFDADSMRWFMMDSLYRTLLENFGEDDVFYSQEDSSEDGLRFEDLYPTNHFPAGIPYMGSAFYFAHSDGRGHIYSEEEAISFLIDKLIAHDYNMEGMTVITEQDAGDPWFGEMAVWYFAWGASTSDKFTAEHHFAVTYDWEIWYYDTLNDEWALWN